MHFCVNCNNMYYIKISEDNENKLTYYCRHCGNEDETLTGESICVSKEQFKKVDQKFTNIINEYTKLDPTLPHNHHILCPNADCISNNKDEKGNKAESDVIYIRYDNDNLKYVYLCCYCDKVWVNNKQ